MKNLYMLKDIRTGVIEYDNLYAQDVHDLWMQEFGRNYLEE